MPKYKVYDNYDCDMELIGETDNLHTARKICVDRENETDGETYTIIKKLINGKYVSIEE